MPSGKAPIDKPGTLASLLAQKWSPRRPLTGGIVSLLTVACWALWFYLVLPLLSLALWALGVRLFLTELTAGGYAGLRTSLLAYSSVLLVLVGLLALWIWWNVVRYGGRNDRRTAKRAEVTDQEVGAAFRLDPSVLATLRGERQLRVDLDGNERVVVTASGGPREPQAASSDADRPAGEQHAERADPRAADLAQRDRDSTRSG
jgi:poly-beta-1,6-N-acetyl-D-glucosamine biosynthesis protein PgaD